MYIVFQKYWITYYLNNVATNYYYCQFGEDFAINSALNIDPARKEYAAHVVK